MVGFLVFLFHVSIHRNIGILFYVFFAGKHLCHKIKSIILLYIQWRYFCVHDFLSKVQSRSIFIVIGFLILWYFSSESHWDKTQFFDQCQFSRQNYINSILFNSNRNYLIVFLFFFMGLETVFTIFHHYSDRKIFQSL